MLDKAYLKKKLMGFLKMLRNEALLKQSDVANCIGKSTAYYGQIERCVRKLDFDIFLDMVCEYKKLPWWILESAWKDDIDFEKEEAALKHEVEWKKKKPKWIKNAKRREVYKQAKMQKPKKNEKVRKERRKKGKVKGEG